MARLPVAVLGATGAVGQRFIQLLAEHPQFEAAHLVGDATAGRPYGDVVWRLDVPMPEAVRRQPVLALKDLERAPPGIAFSGLPGGVAGPVETRLAQLGWKVFTNARDHRMDADVPLVIPEVNADHLALVARQHGPGWIAANGNCTAILLTLALAPLHRAFGLDDVHVTSLQALSGAGYPGVPASDIVGNVLTFIEGEEEKVEREPCKTLGTLGPEGVRPAPIPIHATCTRANVPEGHTESVHVRLSRKASLADVREALSGFRGPDVVRGLHSAPKAPLQVLDAPDRPQPRWDAMLGGGMSVAVGRLRLDADGRGLRFVLLGSNTIRGAAGASVLNAELAFATGLL